MTLRLDQAGYTYPSGATVGPVDLVVDAGEKVLLTGPSGCGKSTLLRLAAGLARRHGRGALQGRVEVAGRDPGAVGPGERASLVAFVSQQPGDQLVTGTVEDEVAFALESAGWGADRIEQRIADTLAQVGLDVARDRDPRTLSGGQQQRLVVAAALATGAPLLLLDEPLAQLDPAAALELLQVLEGLARSGTSVLLVEHRLEPTLPWCDRVVFMASGVVSGQSTPDSVEARQLRDLGLQVPGRMALRERLPDVDLSTLSWDPPAGAGPSTSLISVRDLSHRYGDLAALDGVTLSVAAGERVAVLGGNGAGKSTLLGLLGGLLIPQDPDLSLFCDTVHAELAYGPSEAGRSDADALATELAGALGVAPLLERPPQGLSRGQRLRVAVGAGLSCAPAVLLLDEPTAGQDHHAVESMLAALTDRMGPDTALVFATHDVGVVLRWATRAVVLEAGRVVADGPPATALAELPTGCAVVLPPLARHLVDHGLPPLSLDAVAALVDP